ncbi:hypothetical protein D3C86_977840 [compost metagenome]
MPVGHGLAEAHAFAAVDLDVDAAALEQVGSQQVGRHGGVVHRAAGHAVVGHLLRRVGVEDVGDDRARAVAQLAQPRDARVAREDLVRHVQRQHRDRHAAFQHRLGRMRVGEHVELRHRRDVAAVEMRAGHEHQLAQAAHDVGRLFERQCEVGLRAEHGERHALLGCGAQRANEIVDGAAFGQRHGGVVHGHAREAFAAVDVGGVDRCALQGPFGARVDRKLRPSGPFAGQARVARGLGQGNIARHRGQRLNRQRFGRRQGEQQRDHVVRAGVRVDDQGVHGDIVMPPPIHGDARLTSRARRWPSRPWPPGRRRRSTSTCRTPGAWPSRRRRARPA